MIEKHLDGVREFLDLSGHFSFALLGQTGDEQTQWGINNAYL